MPTERVCCIHKLGRVDYERAWKLQNELAQEITAGKRPATLLLLEHPHTYTFGRRGHAENLLWDADELQRREIALHWVDRGGDVTYHGPGQLVGYPLLPLETPVYFTAGSESSRVPQADYVGYVRKLEQVLILALAHFDVRAGRQPGMTGVWVPMQDGIQAKIAAIGVKVDARGITRHGFALNITTDPEYWEGIIGCGLNGYPVCSLADCLHQPPALEVVADVVTSAFGYIFGYTMQEGLTLSAKLSTL